MPINIRHIIALLLILLSWIGAWGETAQPFWPHMIAEEMVSKPSAEAGTLGEYRDAVIDLSSGLGTLSYNHNDYAGAVLGVVNTKTGALEQFNDYYPYGMPHASNRGAGVNRYKHGGKELTTELGLNLYDYHARLYDPILPRFLQPDSMAGKYHPLSPNIFCAANPINITDPTGKDAVMSIENNTITISANIILIGELATDELAAVYQKDIQNTWGKITSVKCGNQKLSVVWDISVRKIEKGEQISFNGYNNYLEVVNSKAASFVKDSNTGKIRNSGTCGRSLKNDNPMSHEFGHMIGLNDKYGKDIGDNSTYQKPINSKYDNDIMGVPVSVKNRIISNATLNDLLKTPVNTYLKNKVKSIDGKYNYTRWINKYTGE